MTRGSSGTQPVAICNFCNKPFPSRPYKISSGAALYCSRTCKHDSQRKELTEPCDYCGKPVTRKKSSFRRGGAVRVYCDRTCAVKWRGENPSATRLATYGISANKFRGLYGTSCFICGFDRVVEYCHIIPACKGGTVHPSNIVTLCPNHHTLMDKELLTPEEDKLLDDHLIYAWGHPLAARFGNEPEIRKKRKVRAPITLNGESKLLVHWARQVGLDPVTIGNRIDKLGWSEHDAIFTPAYAKGTSPRSKAKLSP